MIDKLWQRIVKEIPSKHLPDRLAVQAFGFRREFLLANPKQYLEVGCRRGHSLASALIASKARATVVDAWIENYGDEPNEGPRIVAHHLRNLRIDPVRVDFRSGDSHVILPTLTGLFFDMILVDGDHTLDGAKQDLIDCLPLLAPNGILYFDDYEPPLNSMVNDFASKHQLNLIPYPRQGDIPAWCKVQR